MKSRIEGQIQKVDQLQLLDRCEKKAPVVLEVDGSVGWDRLWDAALDLGVEHIRGLQSHGQVICHHGRGGQPCQLCDEAY